MRMLENVDRVFLAFNANVDNIRHVDRRMKNIAGYGMQPELGELKSPEDLISAILYSMKYGESAELPMHEAVEKWLSENMKPEKQRMGGQIGIMANLLAALGMRPVVYTPLLSKEQCRLFSKKVLLVDKGLKHPDKIRRNDKKKVNWIFEFDKGQKFLDVKAKQGSRFIAASRPDEFRLKNMKMDFDFSCAILSGFQSILEKYSGGHTYKDQFRIARSLIKKIKARRKPIHIELAFTKNRKIVSSTLALASEVDSIGLDESELINILRFLGEHKLAKRIHMRHDIIDIYLGMKRISKKIRTKKMHIHGRGFFMALCKNYHARPEEIKKSMEFASAVAAAEASAGIRSRKDVAAGLRFPVSEVGKNAGEKLARFLRKRNVTMNDGIAKDRGYIIFVPTRLVSHAKDVVGLGDIISASIFAAETAFSLEAQKERNH